MNSTETIKSLEDKLLLLETKVKHLENDLRLTKEENETSLERFFEVYSHMERKVENRTKELKALHKALEQKGHELEVMLDSSPAIIFYKDVKQKLIRVNKKFAEIVGMPISGILGNNHGDHRLEIHYSNPEKDLEVIEKGEAILGGTEIIDTTQGQRQIVIDRFPHKNKNGEVIGLIGFALDVTELRKSEEEKNKLQDQLHQAQRMESIGTLAGGIAHNFNNLLMGILGNVSLLLLGGNSNQAQADVLNNIEKLVHSGSQLTRQLLGYARPGSFEIKPTNLNQLIIETSNTFALAKKNIKIHRELEKNLMPIKADSGQIEQVLMNLFVNAADAMPQGGDLYIKSINSTHKEILFKPYKPKPGKYVSLTVKDTGIGMDKETIDRSFEPFFTTKGLAQGTGLGLASTYGIIKGHGGYIDVESEPGKGSTFNIYLPASSEGMTVEKNSSSAPVKGNETILLIDDEEMIVSATEDMLKTLGYEVLTALNGRQGIEKYGKHLNDIDIVLLDMIMPDIGGGQTFDKIKEMNPEVKVILISGYNMVGEASEIVARGCNGFLQKPFSLTNLSQKIRVVMTDRT